MAIDTTAARVRSFELSAAGFLRVALASVGALWLIILTGAAVRLTDSGLGCRHWPGCEPGHPLPEKSYHAFIEFGNRVIGGVTIAIVLVTWLAALRTPSLPRWARRLALAIFVGALAQAPLGYLAVKTDLRWPVVAAHLLLSALLLAGAVVLALEAYRVVRGRAEPLVPLELRRAGLLVAAAVLGYLAARRERSPRLFVLGLVVLGALLAQMVIGEIQYRTHLPWPLVLAHVGFAAAVWALVVAFVTVLWRPPGALLPDRA